MKAKEMEQSYQVKPLLFQITKQTIGGWHPETPF